jgi:hypothetical protein
MTAKTLRDVLEHAATWPREDQDELVEYAREIEARRTGIYTMSDDEQVAVGKGMAQADRANSCPTSWWQKLINATDDEGSVHPRSVL